MWFQQTEWHYFFVLKHIDIFTTSLCLDCPTKHCTCELTSVHATNINFLLFLLIFLSQFINHSNLVLKLVISHFGDFQIMRPRSDICHAMPRHSGRHSLTPRCQSWQTKTMFAHILSEFSIIWWFLTHSQMLGKFEYGLPAKIWRLVGCTKMLSW